MNKEKIKEIIIKFIPDIKDIKVDRSQPYPFIAEKIDGSKFLLSELYPQKPFIDSTGLLALIANGIIKINFPSEEPLKNVPFISLRKSA